MILFVHICIGVEEERKKSRRREGRGCMIDTSLKREYWKKHDDDG
jgi:hypothetical protein